jgi:hypothetical protein
LRGVHRKRDHERRPKRDVDTVNSFRRRRNSRRSLKSVDG